MYSSRPLYLASVGRSLESDLPPATLNDNAARGIVSAWRQILNAIRDAFCVG